jgi:hypothetical protein
MYEPSPAVVVCPTVLAAPSWALTGTPASGRPDKESVTVPEIEYVEVGGFGTDQPHGAHAVPSSNDRYARPEASSAMKFGDPPPITRTPVGTGPTRTQVSPSSVERATVPSDAAARKSGVRPASATGENGIVPASAHVEPRFSVRRVEPSAAATRNV